jgi:hypothetical protein
LIKVGKLAHSE